MSEQSLLAIARIAGFVVGVLAGFAIAALLGVLP